MSKRKKETAEAIDALLRSQNELLTYGIDFTIENDRIVTLDIEKENVSVYISCIGEGFTNSKNMRININKELLDKQRKFKKKKGNKSAFIGWFKGSDIFVAWDPKHVLSLSPSPGSGSSISAALSLKHDTTKLRPSIYKADPEKIDGYAFVIAMHSSMLKFYLKNIERLHSMNNEEEIIFAMKNGFIDMENSIAARGNNLLEIPLQYWVQYYKRDPEFRKSVLDAYEYACCVCRKKLGIVEAAHIIPFACNPNDNCIKNGLALCVEHHVLYDKALLMPDHNYKLVFNEMKAKELCKARLGFGLSKVKKFSGKPIKLPKREIYWPCKKRLMKGIKERDPRIVPKP